jgi:hypothetical protein
VQVQEPQRESQERQIPKEPGREIQMRQPELQILEMQRVVQSHRKERIQMQMVQEHRIETWLRILAVRVQVLRILAVRVQVLQREWRPELQMVTNPIVGQTFIDFCLV